jgi:hypothetical protein
MPTKILTTTMTTKEIIPKRKREGGRDAIDEWWRTEDAPRTLLCLEWLS